MTALLLPSIQAYYNIRWTERRLVKWLL